MTHPHQQVDAPPINRGVDPNVVDSPNKIETKDIVTPYAFGVAESLLGKRLATPFQRGVAQCIDLFFVAILSSLDALFLAIIATVTFYKASHNLAKNRNRKTTRSFLRMGGAFMLFWTVLLSLDALNDADYFNDSALPSNPSQNINGTVESTSGDNRTHINSTSEEFTQPTEATVSEVDDYVDPPSHSVSSDYSVVAWAKGIVAELGLGFGWAALYYSVFTAWFNGKTPGKRLLNIQVLKLDGSGLSLWESFGRYGGYGAGLATGLLGFMQIYWDPNRQAIQDKISETLVISTRD